MIAQKPSIVLAGAAAHSFGSLAAPEKPKEEQVLVELDQVTPVEGSVPSPHTPARVGEGRELAGNLTLHRQFQASVHQIPEKKSTREHLFQGTEVLASIQYKHNHSEGLPILESNQSLADRMS